MPVNVLLVTLMGCVVAFIPEGKTLTLFFSLACQLGLQICASVYMSLGNAF